MFFFFISAAEVQVGNRVIARPKGDIGMAFRNSWVDTKHPLPYGTLKSFKIYVHPNVRQQQADMLIWQPVSAMANVYKLIYKLHVTIPTSATGQLQTVSI